MPAKVIVITGTPGTGKTSVTDLVRRKGYFVINLQQFAEKYDCSDGFDEERNSKIVDTDKLEDILRNYLAAGRGIVIIEGHYGDIVPSEYVNKCFVLSCPPNILSQRLNKRNYSSKKIDENVQAEIMQVCWVDALDSFGPSRVTKIDNMPLKEIADLIETYAHIALDRSL